jgi:hypothetical protein
MLGVLAQEHKPAAIPIDELLVAAPCGQSRFDASENQRSTFGRAATA